MDFAVRRQRRYLAEFEECVDPATQVPPVTRFEERIAGSESDRLGDRVALDDLPEEGLFVGGEGLEYRHEVNPHQQPKCRLDDIRISFVPQFMLAPAHVVDDDLQEAAKVVQVRASLHFLAGRAGRVQDVLRILEYGIDKQRGIAFVFLQQRCVLGQRNPFGRLNVGDECAVLDVDFQRLILSQQPCGAKTLLLIERECLGILLDFLNHIDGVLDLDLQVGPLLKVMGLEFHETAAIGLQLESVFVGRGNPVEELPRLSRKFAAFVRRDRVVVQLELKTEVSLEHRLRSGLLHHMRQLMSNQSPSLMLSPVRTGPHRTQCCAPPCRHGRSRPRADCSAAAAGMHPHPRKVVAEALLHVLP